MKGKVLTMTETIILALISLVETLAIVGVIFYAIKHGVKSIEYSDGVFKASFKE